MADLTPIVKTRNGGTVWTETDGAASQTIVMDRRDEAICLLVRNTDAAPCRIKVDNDGFGAEGVGDIDVDIAAGAFAVVGPFESNRVKDPATQKATVQILDQDDTAFSGTVTNVKLTQLNDVKSLID